MSTGANSSTGGKRKKLAPFAAALLGTTIDERFRIEKAIGQGAMGTVFAATQLSVNRRVAIKVLREQISDTSKARFMREARVISAISHPNIVQLIDFGERPEDELLYLVMEYVDGLRMSRLTKRGRVHPNLSIEILSQMCSALAEAHAQGIVHRDLKPSNVLLVRTADGSLQVKVLDFGVAHTYEDAAELTATGVLCGTPAYMAPEQARGKAVTPRVDLYALGVNLYEMLVGFRPFRGATPVEVAMQQIQARPPDLQKWIDQELLPPALVEVADQLLQKAPDARPQTATELRHMLLEVRSHYGWGPVVFPELDKTVWSNWTQPKLGNHGGLPLDGEAPKSTAWSGSWTGRGTGSLFGPGSQPAMHDASGVDAPAPSGSDSHSVVPPATPDANRAGLQRDSAPSQDSLPSRHGGGWDAFRQNPGPSSAQNRPVVPPMNHPVAHVGTATPSEETAHIVQVAERASESQTPVWESDGARAPQAPDEAGEVPVVSTSSSSESAPRQQASAPQQQTSAPQQTGAPAPQPEAPNTPDPEDPQSYIQSTSASYEGMWTSPGTASESLPTFHDAERLEVEHPGMSGTVVSDYEADERASLGDLIRFGLVTILVFLVCAAIGYVLLHADDRGTPASSAGGSAEAQVAQPEATSEKTPSAADEERQKKKEKPKKSLEKKKWKKPIEVFDDPPPEESDEPARKIVIEEAK